MDVSMSTSSALAQTAGDAVGVSTLKKAMDIEAQGAMTLINSIPQPVIPAAANLPAHLGQNVNTVA